MSINVNVCSVLGLIFVVLKLCNVINWNWVWVLCPFWINIAILLIILLLLKLLPEVYSTRLALFLKYGV